VAGCPAAGFPWLHLRHDLLALLCPLLTVALYKVPFPPWTDIWEAYALPFALDPFVGKALARWLVESGRGGRHSRPLPLSILSGPGHFRRYSRWRNLVFIARLWLSSVESPAGCWHSQPFSWSRSSLLDAVETPGTPAGRQRCPWHTPEVIPTTDMLLLLGRKQQSCVQGHLYCLHYTLCLRQYSIACYLIPNGCSDDIRRVDY
jgi:hypothetical protein